MSEELNSQDLSEIIAESFGANATYVEGLLGRYRSNPSLVDEAWRTYFAELLGDGASGGNGAASAASWPEAADVGQAASQPQAEARAEASAAPAQGAQAPSGAQAGTTPAQVPTAPAAPAAAQVRGES
ncbi:MAG: 2-oxoglutarate dehydrogenase E1 subunit family protein, partial [Pyrinomonadaceae bacterium]